MPSNQSGINDDELNQMIANLQRGQRGAGPAAAPTTNATGDNVIPGEKVIQPPVQPNGTNVPVGGSANPVNDLFNQSTDNNTKVDPAKPINLSEAGNNNGSNVTEVASAAPATNSAAPSMSGLEEIRRQAIVELRPLVDKLDLPAEDKFDTLLLLIRTTDDSSLIPAAHTAAMNIADDARRAQALLDVIKEIDFFGRK